MSFGVKDNYITQNKYQVKSPSPVKIRITILLFECIL